jgi:hypothetical protein
MKKEANLATFSAASELSRSGRRFGIAQYRDTSATRLGREDATSRAS